MQTSAPEIASKPQSVFEDWSLAQNPEDVGLEKAQLTAGVVFCYSNLHLHVFHE